jgi:pilus assembly protein TadC
VFVLLLVLFALLGVLRFVVVVHRWWSSRRRRVSVQG